MSYLAQFGIPLKPKNPIEHDPVLPVGHANNPYPIPYHPSWEILDSTKLRSLADCPRGFFFEYMLGWRPVRGSIHLIFGTAWHEAMDVLYQYRDDSPMMDIGRLGDAVEAFMTSYDAEYDPALLAPHKAKSKANAVKVLMAYINNYQVDATEYETLYTELVGSVPISPGKLIHGKMDAMVRSKRDGKLYALEHKTAGQMSGRYSMQWEYDIQPGTYQWIGEALCHTWGKEFGGVVINATVFRTKDHEFFRRNYYRHADQMAMWHAEVNRMMQEIDQEKRILISIGEKMKTERVPALPCFPRRCSSATKYGCRYPTLCQFHVNPLTLDLTQPPEGYLRYFWDPHKKEHNFELTGDTLSTLDVKPV